MWWNTDGIGAQRWAALRKWQVKGFYLVRPFEGAPGGITFTGMTPGCLDRRESPIKAEHHYSGAFAHTTPRQKASFNSSPKRSGVGGQNGKSRQYIIFFLINTSQEEKLGKVSGRAEARRNKILPLWLWTCGFAAGQVHSQTRRSALATHFTFCFWYRLETGDYFTLA